MMEMAIYDKAEKYYHLLLEELTNTEILDTFMILWVDKQRQLNTITST